MWYNVANHCLHSHTLLLICIPLKTFFASPTIAFVSPKLSVANSQWNVLYSCASKHAVSLASWWRQRFIVMGFSCVKCFLPFYLRFWGSKFLGTFPKWKFIHFLTFIARLISDSYALWDVFDLPRKWLCNFSFKTKNMTFYLKGKNTK